MLENASSSINRFAKNKNIQIFIVLFLFSIIAYRQILMTPGVVGHNWDWSIPYFPEYLKDVAHLSLYTWRNISFGQSNILWLPSSPIIGPLMSLGFLGITGEYISKLLILFTSTFAGYCMYLFVKEIIYEERHQTLYFPSFLGGLFYAFSPFLFADLIGGGITQIIAYALFPLFLYFFKKSIRTNSAILAFLTVITLSVLTISLQVLIFASALTLAYGLIQQDKKNYYLNYLKIYLVYVVFNLYWIVPTIAGLAYEMRNPVLRSEFTSFDNINFAVPSLWEIFVEAGYFRPIFEDAIPQKVLPVWFLVTYIASTVTLLVNFLNRKSKESLFWLSVLLISFIFVTGGKEPLGGLVIWFYKNIPLMGLFRSAQHFIILPTIANSVLISLATVFVLSKIKKIQNYLKIVLVIIILFWSLPFFLTGDLGSSFLRGNDKDHIDIYQVSPDYQQTFSYLFNKKEDFRILFLPMAGSVNFIPNDYQRKGQGGDPIVAYSVFDTLTSDISLHGAALGYAVVLEDAICNRNNPTLAKKLIDAGGFKYLLLRQDVRGSFTPCKYGWDSAKEEAFLDQIVGLSKIKNYLDIKLYENTDPLSHIYAVNDEDLIASNNSAENLSAAIDLEKMDPKTNILTNQNSSSFFQALEDPRILDEAHQEDRNSFNFQITQNQDYELWVKNNNDQVYSFIKILINGSFKELPLISQDKGWFFFGKINLMPGQHKLEIILPPKVNLLGPESISLNLRSGDQADSKTLSLKAHGSSVIKVAFEYQNTEDSMNSSLPPRYALYQDTDETKDGAKIPRLTSWLIKDSSWRKSEATIKLNPFTENIDLVFFADKPQVNITGINYRNISITEIFTSPVVLTSIQKNKPSKEIPQLIWQKINPTRYKINVKQSSDPFTLVFLDSFDSKWQAYINSNNTWLDKPVSEDHHFVVNSFANAWTIDKTGDFEIVLEYSPQRLFIIASLISLGAILSSILYLVIKKKIR